MKNYYWLKLHFDIMDDWKIGTLPDSLKWRFIQCLIWAGIANDGGFIGHHFVGNRGNDDDALLLGMKSPVSFRHDAIYETEIIKSPKVMELINQGLIQKHGGALYVSHLFGEYFTIGSDRLNRTTDYKDSLKSQRWKHYRTTVFIRDGFSCTRCGKEPPEIRLHCHHLNYDNVGSEKLEDCKTLCHVCHGKEHGKG